jgi:hypothetical protein
VETEASGNGLAVDGVPDRKDLILLNMDMNKAGVKS